MCVKFSSSTPLIFVCLILNADSVHRCFCCLCELPLDRVGPRQGVREKAKPYPNNKKQQKNKVRLRLLAQSSDFPFRSGSFPRSFLALRKWLLNVFGNHRKSSSSDLAWNHLNWFKCKVHYLTETCESLSWWRKAQTTHGVPTLENTAWLAGTILRLGPSFQRGLELLEEKAERLCSVFQY